MTRLGWDRQITFTTEHRTKHGAVAAHRGECGHL
jgi:hypothetical protein